MKPNRTPIILFVIITGGFLGHGRLWGHCQVPCGIYDDAMRIKMMAEHIATIEKAMTQIETLSREQNPNYNQIVRWVTNKEKHAEEMDGIITYYFMAQRIKPPTDENSEKRTTYIRQLELLHHLLLNSMKAKQGTDTTVIQTLKKLLAEFEKSYFEK